MVKSVCTSGVTRVGHEWAQPTHLKANFCSLFNEMQVLKSVLKDSKLKSIVDLYYELLPLKQGFPTIISLIIAV